MTITCLALIPLFMQVWLEIELVAEAIACL